MCESAGLVKHVLGMIFLQTWESSGLLGLFYIAYRVNIYFFIFNFKKKSIISLKRLIGRISENQCRLEPSLFQDVQGFNIIN